VRRGRQEPGTCAVPPTAAAIAYANDAEKEWHQRRIAMRYYAAGSGIRLASTEVHDCGPRSTCAHCAASIWASEVHLCCSDGTKIVPPAFAPHTTPEFTAYLLGTKTRWQRIINSRLAFVALTTLPSRARGGLGVEDEGWADMHAMGRMSHLFFPPAAHDGGMPSDVYDPDADAVQRSLQRGGRNRPSRDALLLDAKVAQGRQLLAMLNNPLALALQSYRQPIVPEAAAAGGSAAAQVPFSHFVVQHGVADGEIAVIQAAGDHDAPRHSVSLPRAPAPDSVTAANPQGAIFLRPQSSLYEIGRFPLFYPRGKGGWTCYSQRPGEDAITYGVPLSTVGRGLTCFDYTKYLMYQSEAVFEAAPRLMQEWVLDQYSRTVQMRLEYMKTLPAVQAASRARNDLKDMRAAERAIQRGDGTGVAAAAPAPAVADAQQAIFLPHQAPLRSLPRGDLHAAAVAAAADAGKHIQA
jgi:hypothetical protein